MRERPREIYTSVRSRDSVGGLTPSVIRTVVVALLLGLALTVMVVAVLTLT